jgi:hypothetical protein
MLPNNYWIIGAILGTLQVIAILVSWAGYFIIKGNDLKHLGIDVKAIRTSQEKEEERLGKIEISVATQKAVCDERSGMYKLNKKIGAIRNSKS